MIVALAVVVFAVYAAMGRGGELPAERGDHTPLDLGPVSAADVALLRPPSAAWGYDIRATDEALGRIAESIRERDVRIVALEQLVTDLSRDPAPVPLGNQIQGGHHRRAGGDAPTRTDLPVAGGAVTRTDLPAAGDALTRIDPPAAAAAGATDEPSATAEPPATAETSATSEPSAPGTPAAAPDPEAERVREGAASAKQLRQQSPPERSHD